MVMSYEEKEIKNKSKNIFYIINVINRYINKL